jgi:hypothetical protein
MEFPVIGKLKSIVGATVRRICRENTALQYDQLATIRLQPLFRSYEYVPVTTFALRPSALEIVVNEIILSGTKTPRILEIGCGYSTFGLCQVIRDLKGELVSIENDESWIRSTAGLMGDNASFVEFVHAPLKPLLIKDGNSLWYDRAIISNRLSGRRFDYLLVDGPFGGIARCARYPAYSTLLPYLAETGVTFLDDICRPDENEIAQLWCSEHSLVLEKFTVRGGIGLFRKSNTRTRTLAL